MIKKQPIIIAQSNSIFSNLLDEALVELESIIRPVCLVFCHVEEVLTFVKDVRFSFAFIDELFDDGRGVELLKILDREFFRYNGVIVGTTKKTDYLDLERLFFAGARYCFLESHLNVTFIVDFLKSKCSMINQGIYENF